MCVCVCVCVCVKRILNAFQNIVAIFKVNSINSRRFFYM